MNKIFFGIDPGLRGGVVGMDETGDIFYRAKMPLIENRINIHELRTAFLSRVGEVHIGMEKTQSMPKQGISSAHSYGIGAGMIIGAIECLDLAYTLIPPRAWQKEMFIGTDAKLKPKERAKQAAARVFRVCGMERLSIGGKPPTDGIIDAALIAEFIRRRLK